MQQQQLIDFRFRLNHLRYILVYKSRIDHPVSPKHHIIIITSSRRPRPGFAHQWHNQNIYIPVKYNFVFSVRADLYIFMFDSFLNGNQVKVRFVSLCLSNTQNTHIHNWIRRRCFTRITDAVLTNAQSFRVDRLWWWSVDQEIAVGVCAVKLIDANGLCAVFEMSKPETTIELRLFVKRAQQHLEFYRWRNVYAMYIVKHFKAEQQPNVPSRIICGVFRESIEVGELLDRNWKLTKHDVRGIYIYILLTDLLHSHCYVYGAFHANSAEKKLSRKFW